MNVLGWAAALLLAASAAFWDQKLPADWSVEEVIRILTDSPWGQMAPAGPKSPAAPVQIYIATAEPVIQAEDRLRAARKQRDTDPSWDEYREYLMAEHGKLIVVAVAMRDATAFADAPEGRQMEKESVLRIGKRKYKLAGHFPPSSTDPYVRLAFPRDIREGDKALVFELYVPGANYRMAEFKLSDMVFRGQPSY